MYGRIPEDHESRQRPFNVGLLVSNQRSKGNRKAADDEDMMSYPGRASRGPDGTALQSARALGQTHKQMIAGNNGDLLDAFHVVVHGGVVKVAR